MSDSNLLAVYTTVENTSQATKLANQVIEQKLAACVQCDEVKSTFFWRGQVENCSEIRMMFKTTQSQYAALEKFLKQNHPYELPAIFAIPVSHAEKSYQDWVIASLGDNPSGDKSSDD